MCKKAQFLRDVMCNTSGFWRRNLMRDGRYSYRFDGTAKNGSATFVIVGLGSLQIKDLKLDDGNHFSSLARLDTSASVLIHSHFLVTGSGEHVAAEQSWKATLTFVEQNPPHGRGPQTLVGDFRIVAAGADRYWMISTGAKSSVGGVERVATEVVHGELIRVSD